MMNTLKLANSSKCRSNFPRKLRPLNFDINFMEYFDTNILSCGQEFLLFKIYEKNKNDMKRGTTIYS